MRIRHVTAADNVDADGFLVDAARVHHASLSLGRLDRLGGAVDPRTHLNSDFPDHHLDECLVAERLEPGAPMVRGTDGQIVRARPRDGVLLPRGRVDVGARRIEWLRTLARRREEAGNAGR